MGRRVVLRAAALLAGLSALVPGVSRVSAANPVRDVPLPTAAQLAWQEAELAVVFHYDLHVFDGKAYDQGQNRITPYPDMQQFCPSDYDMDQWIRSVKGMGAKVAILTATHETGFALYQSDVNPYCLKALRWRDGRADLVRDFVDACRRHGIRPGIYIGIRWNAFLGVHDFRMPEDGTQFQRNRQTYYNRLCEEMTRELMSRYGELAIVWYDGGGHGPELGGPDILPIVERYQPGILFYHNSQRADIRWGGSETGTVPYPCWGTYPFPYSHSKNQETVFRDGNRLLKTGDPDGAYYMPAMSDTPLRGYAGRHEWFWEPDDEDHIYPLGHLMEIYAGSVGRNSTLILGVTPDDRGRVPAADSLRMAEFGREIERVYGHPVRTVSGRGKSLMLRLEETVPVTHAVIRERIAHGERVRAYVLEGRSGGRWIPLDTGTCIGHKHIVHLDAPVPVTAVRLRITDSAGEPDIAELSVYQSDAR